MMRDCHYKSVHSLSEHNTFAETPLKKGWAVLLKALESNSLQSLGQFYEASEYLAGHQWKLQDRKKQGTDFRKMQTYTTKAPVMKDGSLCGAFLG